MLLKVVKRMRKKGNSPIIHSQLKLKENRYRTGEAKNDPTPEERDFHQGSSPEKKLRNRSGLQMWPGKKMMPRK
jgi:hypothetical protein